MNRDGKGTARNVQVQLHTSINYRQEIVGHTFLPTVQMTSKSAICCRSLPNKNWRFSYSSRNCFCDFIVPASCCAQFSSIVKQLKKCFPIQEVDEFPLHRNCLLWLVNTSKYFLFNFNISLRSDREFLLRFLFKFPIKVSFLKPLVTCEQLIAFNLHWSGEVWSGARRCQLSSIDVLHIWSFTLRSSNCVIRANSIRSVLASSFLF